METRDLSDGYFNVDGTTYQPLTSLDTNGINPHTYLIVTEVVCTVSLIGSLGIIIPFLISPTYRRLRHRLIVGLAISDLVVALVILIDSSIALSGDTPENDTSCRVGGFFFSIAILGAAISTLCIAVCTYALLMNPLSKFVEIISKPWTPFWMWFVSWCIGAIVTGAGYAVYGFQRSTLTICFFGNNSGQFQNLVLLLPRCIVFLAVILLYARLVWHFTHAHSSIVVSDFDESMPAQPPENAFSPLEQESRRGSAATATDTTGESNSKSRMFGSWSWSGNEPPHGDGKAGSTVVLLPPPTSPKSKRPSLKRMLSSKSRLTSSKAAADAAQPMIGLETSVRWTEKVEDGSAKERHAGLPISPSDTRLAPPLVLESPTSRPPLPRINSRTLPSTASSPTGPASVPASPPVSGDRPSAETATPPTLSPVVSRSSPSEAKSSNFMGGSLALALSRSISRPSPRQSPTVQLSSRAPPVPSAQAIVAAGDAARRRASKQGPEADENGLLGMSAALFDDGSSSTATKERRMSATEMNRKASIMMTLYPLAYIILFSVSIARLGNDIAAGNQAPNSVLTVLSKWLIYASGFVDCMVFLVIEGGVRHLMRRV